MFSEQLARSAVQNLFTEGENSSVCVCLCVCHPKELNWCKRRLEERHSTVGLSMCTSVYICMKHTSLQYISVCVDRHKTTSTLLLLSPLCLHCVFLCPPHHVSYALLLSLFLITFPLLFAFLPLCPLCFCISFLLFVLYAFSFFLVSHLFPRE